MHQTLVVLGALALIAGSLNVQAVDVRSIQFVTPAQFEGQVAVHGGGWIAFFFSSGNEASFFLDNLNPQFTNYTYRVVEGSAPPAIGHFRSPPLDEERTESGPTGLGMSPIGTASSIILKADSVTLSIDGGLEAYVSTTDSASLIPESVSAANPFWRSSLELGKEEAVLLTQASRLTTFAVELKSLTEVQWFGLDVECPAGKICPSSGGAWSIADGGSVSSLAFSYVHGFAPGGMGKGSGSASVIGFGGNSLDLALDGRARLPQSNFFSCACDEARFNQTLTLLGNLTFENLRPTKDHRLEATFAGTLTEARLDEAITDPSNILRPAMIATTAVIAGLLATLKFFVAPFFTRLTKDQALEHPRRRQIFDYIQQNPGANFREVARETGIAAGTVRHHLNVLSRSDIVVEHQHGSTVRLFENLSRYQSQGNWADHVLLREPPLGELYAWLKANPGAPQKAVLEGMEPAGWSRSTTQHRLSRLVDGGLATIRLQGRLKIYTAVERSAPKPPPGLGPGPSSAAGLGG